MNSQNNEKAHETVSPATIFLKQLRNKSISKTVKDEPSLYFPKKKKKWPNRKTYVNMVFKSPRYRAQISSERLNKNLVSGRRSDT